MIVYRKAGIQIAESYYEDSAPAPDVDIVRYRSRTRQVEGVRCEQVHTILTHLGAEEDALFGRLNRTRRNLVHRAAKEGCSVEMLFQPGAEWLEAFLRFYATFAAFKRLAPANRERLEGLRQAGALALSRGMDAEGEVLVWHCYITAGLWTRLQHSASLFRAAAGKERIAAIERANCLLHWRDMLDFRQRGFTAYDMGGWYAGQTDGALVKINAFKESFGGEVTRLYDGDQSRSLRGAVALSTRRLIGRLRGEKG